MAILNNIADRNASVHLTSTILPCIISLGNDVREWVCEFFSSALERDFMKKKDLLKKRNLGVLGLLVLLSFTVLWYTMLREQDYDKIFDDLVPASPFVVTASELGMIPNDPNQSNKNSDILYNAITYYNNNSNESLRKAILIDNAYYINGDSQWSSRTYKNIDLDGISQEGKLYMIGDKVKMFNISADVDTISIRNIIFENQNDSDKFFVLYPKDIPDRYRIESIIVSDCEFEGNVSLIMAYGDKWNTSVDNYGIDYFEFSNSKVANTTYSFIKFSDYPVKECVIDNNEIKNFKHSFMSNYISNDSQIKDLNFAANEQLTVTNNYVTSDEDWWAEDSDSMYYTFIMFEGLNVLYDNNHVEGLKTSFKKSVYDAYLSAKNVIYTNNTWINNVCLAPDKEQAYLLKSKGGPDEAGFTRIYEGNTFIIEDDYITSHGGTLNDSWIYLYEMRMGTLNYTISNNYIDVYNLKFPASSMTISNFVFEDNEIISDYSDGIICPLRRSSDNNVESIKINNNNINIADKKNGNLNFVRIINYLDTPEEALSVEVNNNSIVAPISYLFIDTTATSLNVSNNDFVRNNGTLRIYYGGNVGSFNINQSDVY